MSDIKQQLDNAIALYQYSGVMQDFYNLCKDSANHIAQQEALIAELRKDAERYKTVRKMNLPEFEDIYHKNLITGVHFDDLVDAKTIDSKDKT